jgi:drug/metabolite transporter (DMT)-like permease
MDSFFQTSFLGPFCAFCSSVTWAMGSAGYSRLSKTYSPFSINLSRALVSFPLSVLATLFLTQSVQDTLFNFSLVQPHHVAWLAVSMISTFGLGDVLFLWSAKSLGISTALAIASCYPIWTVLAGYLFGGEKISLLQLLGLMATIGGVMIVLLSGKKKTKKEEKLSHFGLFLSLITSFFWAANTYSAAQGSFGLTSGVGTSMRMLVGIVICLFFGRVIAPKSPIFLPKAIFVKNLWLFIVEGFIGGNFFMYGMGHSPLALGTTLASLAPVLSVPVTVALGIEKFSMVKTLGICTVVLGIWLLVGNF